MKFSIYFRILLFSLSLSIISLVTVVSFNYVSTQKILRKGIEETLKNKSGLIFSSIDRFLDERFNDLVDFKNQSLRLPLNESFTEENLRLFLKGQHGYGSISFFSPERILVHDSHGIGIGEECNESTYWPNLETNSLAIDISHSKTRNKQVLHIATEVRRDGVLEGYLVARISTSQIFEMFDFALQEDVDELLKVELISKEGNLLYTNQKKQGYVKKKYKKTRDNNLLIESDSALISVHFKDGFNDYKSTNWVLVLTALKKNVFSEMQVQAGTSIRIALGILLIVVIASFYFSYKLTYPLRKLIKASEKYGNGQLTNVSIINRKDEIGVLSKSMSAMALKLDQRIKAQEDLNLQVQYQFEKEKNQKKQITSSIECARRIQGALLPKKDDCDKNSLLCNVLYKPRNIVSGDFYFTATVETIGGTFRLVAVIDCTGHGVPGAFLTIIANNLLSQIVTVDKVVDPISIIREMDLQLYSLFNVKGDFTRLKEGMDMSILSYNETTNKLYFSGANQRLLYFKQRETLEEYKGFKGGLGDGRLVLTDLNETGRIEIDVQPKDLFVLYTDGIVDQFGGEKNKKFSKRRLVEIIKNYKDEKSEIIRDLLHEEIVSWKSQVSQTDDMLIAFIELNELYIKKKIVLEKELVPNV